jgi:hypothetical protein
MTIMKFHFTGTGPALYFREQATGLQLDTGPQGLPDKRT